MTDVLSGFAHPHLAFASPADNFEHSWQAGWEDFNMLSTGFHQGYGQQINQNYNPSFTMGSEYFEHNPSTSSPHLSYTASDIGTPSTVGYQETVDGFASARMPAQISQEQYQNLAHQAQSPPSSIGIHTPNDQPMTSPPIIHVDGRPPIKTNKTAPAALESAGRTRRPGRLRSGSEEDDEDYGAKPTPKRAGNKRQRIPHTAVERRYRENLNAHLEKLRQTVPTLNSRNGGSKDGSEGVKPSKCEVLHAAIEYIIAQEKELAAKDKIISDLSNANQALRYQRDQYMRHNSR